MSRCSRCTNRANFKQYQNYPITIKGNDGLESKIHIQLRYLPIKMDLEPSESINNMGKLRCDILDAADLPAADRNGFSDPYCKFELNGKPVFKTQVQKKTLHPSWNEFFEVDVPSRTAAEFKLECWDWDRTNEDDYLGSAVIDLRDLQPLESQEVKLVLDGKSGTVRLRMLFRPNYVTRTRQSSSTFSGTFAAPGKIIGAPVKGVGKGAVFVGNSVARSATFVANGFRRRKSGSGEDELVESTGKYHANPSPMPSSPPTPAPRAAPVVISTPIYAQSMHSVGPTASISDTTGHARGESGTLTFTVVSATGYVGANIRVLVKQQVGKGMKEVYKTKQTKATADHPLHFGEATESFKVSCTSDTAFTVQVKDVHTFGPDEDLGSADVRVTGQGDQVITCGRGNVVVRTEFKVMSQSMDGAAGSIFGGNGGGNGSLLGGNGTVGSSRTKLRKSFYTGRVSREHAATDGKGDA